MPDNPDDNGVALPRRVRRQHDFRASTLNDDTQRQMERFKELCGPVIVRKIDKEEGEQHE